MSSPFAPRIPSSPSTSTSTRGLLLAVALDRPALDGEAVALRRLLVGRHSHVTERPFLRQFPASRYIDVSECNGAGSRCNERGALRRTQDNMVRLGQAALAALVVFAKPETIRAMGWAEVPLSRPCVSTAVSMPVRGDRSLSAQPSDETVDKPPPDQGKRDSETTGSRTDTTTGRWAGGRNERRITRGSRWYSTERRYAKPLWLAGIKEVAGNGSGERTRGPAVGMRWPPDL